MERGLCLLMLVLLGSSIAEAQDEGGVYVRLLSIRVEPDDDAEWEAAVEDIAAAARSSDLAECCDWLLYRQGPYRYRAVFFSEGLGDLDTPESFTRAFTGTPGEAAFQEAARRLQATRYEVAEDVIIQQVQAWSTTADMDPVTHPQGRMTEYWVRPGAEQVFDAAMREHAALLQAVGYPYPIESFRWRVGSPGVNHVVVFPDTWEGFFGENDVRVVLRRHGREGEYDALMERVAAAVYRVEQHDIDYARSLSY